VEGKRFRIAYWTMFIIDGLTLQVMYDSNVHSDPAYPQPWVGGGRVGGGEIV